MFYELWVRSLYNSVPDRASSLPSGPADTGPDVMTWLPVFVFALGVAQHWRDVFARIGFKVFFGTRLTLVIRDYGTRFV